MNKPIPEPKYLLTSKDYIDWNDFRWVKLKVNNKFELTVIILVLFLGMILGYSLHKIKPLFAKPKIIEVKVDSVDESSMFSTTFIKDKNNNLYYKTGLIGQRGTQFRTNINTWTKVK